MKIFYALILILLFNFSKAQEYTPMLDPEKGWEVMYNMIVEPYGMEYEDYQYRLTDEILNYNGHNFTKVEYRKQYRLGENPPGPWTDWTSNFYLREDIDDKKVYIYYLDGNEHHPAGEFLLFNFSLEVGDLMNMEGLLDSAFYPPSEILNITYEDVFGLTDVKTFHLLVNDEFEYKVYEGIGSSHGINMAAFEYDFGWTMISHEILTNKEQEFNTSKIFPNPFSHQLQIESEKPILSLQLYDSTGKLIQNKSSIASLNASLSQLKSGPYILTIIFKDREKESVKLIKK